MGISFNDADSLLKEHFDFKWDEEHEYLKIYDKTSGDIVADWSDSAHYDYPEDLTWDRTAIYLFMCGVIAGVNLIRDNCTKEELLSAMDPIFKRYKESP